MNSDSWQCQGRQEHGWFGDGTCPKSKDNSKSPCANCLNAATDRAIKAAEPHLTPKVAAPFHAWVAKSGRPLLHQAAQKLAPVAKLDKPSFARAALGAHADRDTAADLQLMSKNLNANAKNPHDHEAAEAAGQELAKQANGGVNNLAAKLTKVVGKAAVPGAEATEAAPGNAAKPAANDIAQRAKVDKLTKAQAEVMNNPRYVPHDGHTFCNQATCAVVSGVGAPTRPFKDSKGQCLTANAIRANLAKPGSGYHPVSMDDAQKLADKNVLVIVTGPKHVATVAAESVQELAGHGPVIANVGRENGIKRLSRVFTAEDRKQVIFYTPDQ